MVSKKQLKKISSRVRSGSATNADFLAIEEYCNSKIDGLINSLFDIGTSLNRHQLSCLISGRPKRLKSVVRKLERTPGMNLSNVVDLAGVRIIVGDISDQNLVVQHLCHNLDCVDLRDYRDREMYRAVHIYIDRNEDRQEVQVRTLPQQLWANESERLGERVKEGTYTVKEESFLQELSLQCLDIDNGNSFAKTVSEIGSHRGAIDGVYPKLVQCFEEAVCSDPIFKNYLLTYDGRTNELLKFDMFSGADLKGAILEFRRLAKALPQDQYDVLMLNSTSRGSLKVTHPIYFPM